MIEKLLIQNFQIHKKLKIEFDKRITVIIGPSDVGKSAVIRALRWVCMNQPQGDSFITSGEDSTCVRLLVDGHKITRKRGKSTNKYRLDDEEYKAFGSSVPDTISSVLRLGEVNFQSQHDPVYWFSLSAGEVSRQLNSVVDLSIIDDALYKVGKSVRDEQKNLELCQKRQKESTDKLEGLLWVSDANDDFIQVEKLAKESSEVAEKVLVLRETIKEIQGATKEQEKYRQQWDEIKQIGMLGSNLKKLEHQTSSISSTIEKIKDQEIEVNQEIPEINDLVPLVDLYSKVETKINRLVVMIQDAKAISKTVENSEKEQRAAEIEIKDKTGGECPICGGVLNA